MKHEKLLNKEQLSTTIQHFNEAKFELGDFIVYEEFQCANTSKLSQLFSGLYTVLEKCSDLTY